MRTKTKPRFTAMGPKVYPQVRATTTTPDDVIPDKLNRYDCIECKGSLVTVERVKGVTPMYLECRVTAGCGGYMRSSFYREVGGVPGFEWRKPTPAEFRKMSAEMKDHITRGGLELYPIGPRVSVHLGPGTDLDAMTPEGKEAFVTMIECAVKAADEGKL